MSGSNPVVASRSALRRSASPTIVLSAILAVGGVGVLWAVFGHQPPPADLDPIDPKAITVRRMTPKPDAVVETPAAPVLPVTQRLWSPPMDAPAAPAATAAPAAAIGPMVTHYNTSSTGAASRPEAERPGRAVAASAPRGGVTYRPAQIEGGEAVVIGDLGRTLKPTTRIGCTLTQAIDGTHAGPLVCSVARPVMSWDGLAELLPAGTPIIGNYQPLSVGQGRMMAMAATAWRSDGLAVPLGGAPMTDPLGRVGMDGHVDTRFWERVGNAIITDAALSAIALPSAALRSQSNGVQFNTSDTEGVVNQVLSSTVNLPPVFHKNQGEEVQILVTAPVHFGALRFEAVR